MDPERIAEIAEHLKKGRSGDVALTDVMALAELMVGSMQDFFHSLDHSVYSELREIATYISRTKDEIRNLRANDIKDNHIPVAGLELDAIVRSTEAATNTIMEQAELIMSADSSDAEAYGTTVNDAVMQIFEACSFQDLTGQRISKIVETLAFIDSRVARFAEVIGEQENEGTLSEEETAREKRKAELLLNGPQMEGEGVDQDAVDSLLNGGSEAPAVDSEDESDAEETSQADIDALFD
jgi:chemotaxis protein CheZ